ncbi:glutamate receptor U1-like [Panulirus ornatus]|uniref:glutamate receptor U1-like n=1 Tax=Panulirus ornatus TaxID=150431 RepID=UPI003A84FCD1
MLRVALLVAVTALVFILSVYVLPSASALPRPYSGRETLAAAGGAIEAVLARGRRSYRSLILLTDGTTSATAIFTELGALQAEMGLMVFEVPAKHDSSNTTQVQLSWLVGEARQLLQASGRVMVVVASDDPTFLAAATETFQKARLLTWSNRLLAVTRRPLQDLPHLYASFSITNAILVIVATPAPLSRCKMYVHMPYRPREAKLILLGSWSTRRGLTLATDLPLFPEKFSKFAYGPSFVAVAEQYSSYVEKDPAWKPGQPLDYRGPVIQLLDVLAKTLNFTYTFVQSPDGKWGTKEADGSWSGMVGMVSRKEVDMGIGPFSLSLVRTQAVDYMRAFVDDSLKIIGGRGKPEVDPWGFLLPLGPLVWTSILTALLVVAGATSVFLYCYPQKAPQSDWYTDSVFQYIRILLQQEYSSNPHERWYERLLLGTWMLTTLVLTRSYSGNLMSMLAVRHISQPYQYLRDVLDDPSVTMIWEAGTVYVQHLRDARNGTFREVMDARKNGRLMLVSGSECRRALETLVADGRHVLFLEDTPGRSHRADIFSLTGRCDFYTSKEHFMPTSMSMIGQKAHPLVPALSKSIKFVKEFGIFDHWMKNFKFNSTRCVRPPRRTTVRSSLAVSNLWGMFVVVCGGSGMALLLLCVELVVARLSQTR